MSGLQAGKDAFSGEWRTVRRDGVEAKGGEERELW